MKGINFKINLFMEVKISNKVCFEFIFFCQGFYCYLFHLLGSQTLGEEYTSIVQVDSSRRKIPSKLVSALFVLIFYMSLVLVKQNLLHFTERL